MHVTLVLGLKAKCWQLETGEKEHTSVLTALFGYIDVLITWLLNANYTAAYLMPYMPIAVANEFPPATFYSSVFYFDERNVIKFKWEKKNVSLFFFSP